MSREDKEEIKEILHDYVTGVIARQDAKFDIINIKLDLIKEQTTKHNSRMVKVEAKVQDLEIHNKTRESRCPNTAKIRVLEDNKLTTESIKKWITQSIVTTSIIISVLFTVLNYFV